MSQDQPPIEPTDSEFQPAEAELESPNPPQMPVDAPEAGSELPGRSTSTSEQSLQQTLQQVWSKTQPVLKTQTIKTLQATIRVLERVVDRLEAPPPEVSRSPSELDSTRSSLTFSLPPLPIADLRQKLLQVRQGVSDWWNPVLEKIRARLPESINQSLSDRALTGVLAGSLVLLFWITSSLLSGKPAQVAVVPAPRPVPFTAPAIAPEPPVASPAPVAPVTPIVPEASPSPAPNPAPQVSPAPVMLPPAPAPKLQLTPEQKLIAAIQDQVAEISNQYVSGLIQSVQANFRASRLTVKVSPEWYGLTRSQQDTLASEMLQRAQQLDFVKLEITDSEGTLLARSPVVGSEMVIVKRSAQSESA